MVLGTFAINLGPLIAGAGIIGIALGFGAQDLVKDFLSGVFMLIEDQYGVGDIIDAGEATGVVEGVTLRSTRIRDVEGTLWHVPNGEIRRVGNMSQEWARSLLDVAVAYGADIDVVSELIQRVASEMAHEPAYQETFLDEPEMWGVQDLGNDAVALRLVIKTRPGEQWAISRELRRRIKNAFDAADVEIPFPQRTVWLRTEKPVSFGGADAAPFEHRVPDEAAIRRAVAASKRGDTGGRSEFAELLPDEPEDADSGTGDEDQP
jgi:small conductance mechanosensitive channel